MASRPLDKCGTEDLFECHELAADGGQGKTQLTACGRQVPSIRNLNEHPHRRELVHGRIIAKNGKMSRKIPRYSPKPGDSIFRSLDDGTEERAMKICVFGAGAIGGYMAGELALAGPDVGAIDPGAHLAAIPNHGLQLVE